MSATPPPSPSPSSPSPRPVRRTASQRQARALAIAGGSVVGAILVVVLGLRLASDPDVQTSLGDEVFRVGQADRLARRVAEGGPLLFQDLLQRSRDIYVTHEGDDSEQGWSAVEAHLPGQERTCVLQWSARRFRDPCTNKTYAPDSADLTRYEAEVVDGTVVVDLRS